MRFTSHPLRHALLFTTCFLGALSTTANNISTSTGSLTGNTGSQVFVKFNITWQNSWRINPDRWDAAWVFVKYRTSNGVWGHARLEYTGHVAPTGVVVTTGLLDPTSAFNASTNPGIGAFIHRSADGTGTFTANNVQLLWNFVASGVSLGDVVEVRVFAIEMVYVAQGAFAAGSGGSEPQRFTLTTISTGNATTAPGGTGALGGQAGGFPTAQTAPSNANWPNGFNAHYTMKYELAQQQYVDFLNTLTRAQQNARTATDISGTAITNRYVMPSTVTVNARNGIRCDATLPTAPAPVTFYCDLNGNNTGGEATDGKEVACNWLSCGDLLAYLDWSGLRPMTELEYEKACRGILAPVAGEYAWGTTGIGAAAVTLSNAGAINEGIAVNFSATLGNAAHNLTNSGNGGPLRVGIFAANTSNTSRETAGAGAYGIMELSGNIYERAVTIGNADGRAYTGQHGNGVLGADGSPDAAGWPNPTTGSGMGFRGGGWNNSTPDLRVSDRFFAANTDGSRTSFDGGRGVRTAP